MCVFHEKLLTWYFSLSFSAFLVYKQEISFFGVSVSFFSLFLLHNKNSLWMANRVAEGTRNEHSFGQFPVRQSPQKSGVCTQEKQ